MDELVRKLEELTRGITEDISTVTYEQLAEFVEAREALIAHMRVCVETGSSLAQYEQRVKAILRNDSFIMEKMLVLRKEASMQLLRMNQGRRQKEAYEPMDTPDSLFLDKKK